MPLKRTSSPANVDGQDDVEFQMTAPDGSLITCRADRDYVIAIAPDDRPRPIADIFEEMRARIELEASEYFDLHGADRNGEIRLAPIIA